MRSLTYWLLGIATALALLHALVWWDSRDDGTYYYRLPQSIETCIKWLVGLLLLDCTTSMKRCERVGPPLRRLFLDVGAF